RAMNMAPFIFWNLAFYTIIRTQLSDEITEAIAEVIGCDPLELIWAATIEKSHPKIQKSLMNINASLMKKGIELEKKYPIPDQMDEIDTDKYISSIPEYKKF
ncbi:hypothetical protein ABNF72_17105, partial [Paenibacillus larvae]